MMDDETRAILEAADDILSDPERWTQGALARAMDGREVVLTSCDAVAWCATGAICRATATLFPGLGGHFKVEAAVRALGLGLGFPSFDQGIEAHTFRLGLSLQQINDGKDMAAAYRAIRQLFATALGGIQ